MDRDKEIERLKNEILDLRETVSTLTNLVNRLTSTIETQPKENKTKTIQEGYRIFDKSSSSLEHDVSWTRLVNLLHKSSSGLSATELSEKWGKSRTRTSEVLNKLVEEGYLTKYRDGREIKFRPAD